MLAHSHRARQPGWRLPRPLIHWSHQRQKLIVQCCHLQNRQAGAPGGGTGHHRLCQGAGSPACAPPAAPPVLPGRYQIRRGARRPGGAEEGADGFSEGLWQRAAGLLCDDRATRDMLKLVLFHANFMEAARGSWRHKLVMLAGQPNPGVILLLAACSQVWQCCAVAAAATLQEISHQFYCVCRRARPLQRPLPWTPTRRLCTSFLPSGRPRKLRASQMQVGWCAAAVGCTCSGCVPLGRYAA